jgi:hypothetical protein
MTTQKISIIRSETWSGFQNIIKINDILEEAIKEFLSDSDEIINIEKHTESNGLSRFWIYVKSIS